MPKVSIIGAGSFGTATAFSLLLKDVADIVLLDSKEGLPQGKALDLMHARSIELFEHRALGTNDLADTAGSDVVIFTMDMIPPSLRSKETIAPESLVTLDAALKKVLSVSPDAVIICALAPLDIMTQILLKKSGLPKNRVMGLGGVLDSAMFEYALCAETNASPSDVEAWVIGAHGENSVCLPDFSMIESNPLANMMSAEAIERSIAQCKKSYGDICEYSREENTCAAAAASAGKMVEALLCDSSELMSVCTYLDGEYGIEGVCLSVPSRLGKNGVEEIVEFDISEEEHQMLVSSAETLRDAINSYVL